MIQAGCMSDYPNCVWSSSELGDYYGDVDGRKGYIPITKNQTSSIIPHLQGKYFPMNTFDDFIRASEFICIIRDPLERYISGLCEYIRGPGSMTKVIKGWHEGKYIFGKHTEPQHWSLIPFISKQVRYIGFTKDSPKEVLDFLNIKDIKIKYKNKTDKKLLREVQRSVLLIESDIKAFLNQDYEYINKYIKINA